VAEKLGGHYLKNAKNIYKNSYRHHSGYMST